MAGAVSACGRINHRTARHLVYNVLAVTRISTLILLLPLPLHISLPPLPSPHSPLASPPHQAGDCKQCPHPPSLGATQPTSNTTSPSEKSLFMVKQCPELGDDSWAAAIISSLIFSPHYLHAAVSSCPMFYLHQTHVTNMGPSFLATLQFHVHLSGPELTATTYSLDWDTKPTWST